MKNPNETSRKLKKNRGDRFELRLEEDEKLAFKEAADLSGVPLASWVRERLRKAAKEELEGFGRTVLFLRQKKEE